MAVRGHETAHPAGWASLLVLVLDLIYSGITDNAPKMVNISIAWPLNANAVFIITILSNVNAVIRSGVVQAAFVLFQHIS